jgi:hypothetical protein
MFLSSGYAQNLLGRFGQNNHIVFVHIEADKCIGQVSFEITKSHFFKKYANSHKLNSLHIFITFLFLTLFKISKTHSFSKSVQDKKITTLLSISLSINFIQFFSFQNLSLLVSAHCV